MKKVLFLLPFFLFAAILTANAQSCATASKACCAGKTSMANCAEKASKAASADANIEKRTATDGSVSYVRKESDAQGNVKFVSVQFDETANAFVNVAPKSMATSDKAGMTKKSAACAAGSSGKACCAGKAKAEAAPLEQ